LRIGREVAQSARRAEPAAGQTVMVLNAHEPATNNGLALAVVQDWQRRRPGSAATFEFSNLPVNHDIIDPSNPLARTAIVYPKLTELIEA